MKENRGTLKERFSEDKKVRLNTEETYFSDKAKGKRTFEASFYKDQIYQVVEDYLFFGLSQLDGRWILDYGCGCGDFTTKFARRGARVTGVDLSLARLKTAQKKIKEINQDTNVSFCKMDAENMAFHNNSFDLVFGGAILHHLDIEIAITEIERVLKPDGEAFFIEPMGHNPIINLYRRLTPNSRTPDEHPLLESDLSFFNKHFSTIEVKGFHFLTLLSLFWQAIWRNDTLFKATFEILYRIDQRLFKLSNFFGRNCWISVIRLTNKKV